MYLFLTFFYNSFRKGSIFFPKSTKISCQKAVNLLKQLLSSNQEKRPTAKEALKSDFFSTEIKFPSEDAENLENIEPAIDANKFHLNSMRNNFSKIKTNSITMSSIHGLHTKHKSCDRNDSGALSAGGFSMNSSNIKTFFPSITISYVG